MVGDQSSVFGGRPCETIVKSFTYVLYVIRHGTTMLDGAESAHTEVRIMKQGTEPKGEKVFAQ
eukprot:12929003-Prorocentrum_lima.AAC.1